MTPVFSPTELYSGVALSKNTVSTFLNDLGKTTSLIASFMRNQTTTVGLDHHLLVDGTLKSDESCSNHFRISQGRQRPGVTRDISVLQVFDLDTMEPICSKCFPENMLGKYAGCDFYKASISENGITRDIIVADKGFPSSAAEQQFRDYPDLYYLNPLRRNASLEN